MLLFFTMHVQKGQKDTRIDEEHEEHIEGLDDDCARIEYTRPERTNRLV
jgi:hypothetical protein